MKNTRTLFIAAAIGLLLAVIIDARDDNPLKLAGTVCLFAGFAIQAVFYPLEKGRPATYVALACFVAAIGIWLYRIFGPGL